MRDDLDDLWIVDGRDPLDEPNQMLPVRKAKTARAILDGAWKYQPQIERAWLISLRYQAAFPPVARLYMYLWLVSDRGKVAVRLLNGDIAVLGIDRYAKYDCLKKLEAAGLIRVNRSGTKAPIITVLKDFSL
jgi:hypothetical protein